MPSPFPGMDPFLEHPALWPDVHHRLITLSSDELTAQVRPKYVVRIELRVYISDEEDPGRRIIPDLRIAAAQKQGSVAREAATAAFAEPLVLTTLLDEEIREAALKIVHRESGQTVTVIEFLSPANKYEGARGRGSYEAKRHEVMTSSSHLVEVDLLRAGRRHSTMPPADYLVHVSRAERRPQGFVWPIPLPQLLPVIPIPLKKEDRDANLDLQKLLATVYERAAYDADVDYTQDPVPPLPAQYRNWALEMIEHARAAR